LAHPDKTRSVAKRTRARKAPLSLSEFFMLLRIKQIED
jgi:hypothetical protein